MMSVLNRFKKKDENEQLFDRKKKEAEKELKQIKGMFSLQPRCVLWERKYDYGCCKRQLKKIIEEKKKGQRHIMSVINEFDNLDQDIELLKADLKESKMGVFGFIVDRIQFYRTNRQSRKALKRAQKEEERLLDAHPSLFL